MLYCAHPSTYINVYYTREYSYVLYMMTVQFYNYLAAVEVQPQSVATPTHKFTRARYSFDRCCTTSGTNNRLSGTNSTNPGLSRRFRDSWSLCQDELDWTLPYVHSVCPVKCREVTVKKKRVETFRNIRYGDGRIIGASLSEPHRGTHSCCAVCIY